MRIASHTPSRNMLAARASWTVSQRIKNDVIFALATVALGATSRLSRPTLMRLGGWIGRVCHAAFHNERTVATRNVALVFPDWSAEERERLVRSCFVTLGHALGETVAQLRATPPPFPIEPRSRALLEDARKHPAGVLFVSAHLGPWERVAVSLVQSGLPLTTLARAPYDARFQSIYKSLRDAHGIGVIYRGDPHAAIKMVRTLRDGTLLGMPMDLKTSVDSIAVPFLGHEASTPIGPAKLALRTGAKIIVGTLSPSSTGEPEITATCIATDGLSEQSLTKKLNDEISRRVLAYPEAWPWMHARWS